MGTFHITLAVGDPQGESYVPVEALVGTGATYTMLPASMLQNLVWCPMTVLSSNWLTAT